MGQEESIEVFKSGVISNEKSKEGEQSLRPCKVDGLLIYRDGKSNAESFHGAKVSEFADCYHH